jgi:acyl-CoA thioesterase FadM
VTHRPERDGSAITSAHVPYYLALELAALAWARLLDECGQGLLAAGGMAVVRTEFDFRRELFTGFLDAEVDVASIGRSSVSVAVALHQHDQLAATGTTVMARTDEARLLAVPLSPEQRAMLESLVRA